MGICGRLPMRSYEDSSGKCPLSCVTFVFFLWLYYLVILADSTFFFSLYCSFTEGVHFTPSSDKKPVD